MPEFLAGELDAVEVVSFEDLAAIFESPAASGARLTPADVKIFDFNSDFVQTAMIPDAIVANNDWLAANEDAASRSWLPQAAAGPGAATTRRPARSSRARTAPPAARATRRSS